MKRHPLKKDLLDSLPGPRTEKLDEAIIQAQKGKADSIIVLDDDPTGTQTVHDIPVLTTWNTGDMVAEMNQGTTLFYILTNSRSLTAPEAAQLGLEIGANLREAEQLTGKKILVISRSDSTLRGHYPIEVQALEKGLGIPHTVHFIVPAFFEGGRYTVNNIHYVQSGVEMVPAAETPFARDATFGYQNSELKAWVEEKTSGHIPASKVESLSIAELREGSLPEITEKLNGFAPGSACIVNAADYQDLKTFSLALLRSNCHAICRSAASLVPAIAGQNIRPLLNESEVSGSFRTGALTVVGSYVPKTSQQLKHLLENRSLFVRELKVADILQDQALPLGELAKQIDEALSNGQEVLLYTSRDLVTGNNAAENLAIGNKVATYLTDLVGALSVRPKYILAKGGITSSTVATDSLRVKKALVMGQIIAGVPVWKLGTESKFPGLSYIVFPGNVGDDDALTIVAAKLNSPNS